MKYHAETVLTENGVHFTLQENALKVNNADFSTRIKRTMEKAIRSTTRKIEDVPRAHTKSQIAETMRNLGKAKARVRAREKGKAAQTQETQDLQVDIATAVTEAQAKADKAIARADTTGTTIDIDETIENKANLAKKIEAKVRTKITRKPQLK